MILKLGDQTSVSGCKSDVQRWQWGELSVKEKLKLLHAAMADYDDQAIGQNLNGQNCYPTIRTVVTTTHFFGNGDDSAFCCVFFSMN